MIKPYIPSRLREIIAQVADEHRVSVDSLLGPCKRRVLAQPRQEAMRRIREASRLSFPQIGAIFNRDHTTVMWAVYRAKVYPPKGVCNRPKCIDPDARRESVEA